MLSNQIIWFFDLMIYDVIVIGAGISGIIASKKLKDFGFNIITLEARDRIGKLIIRPIIKKYIV